jgi:redox-sensitive bicupin YhaK (pirin superfamily)
MSKLFKSKFLLGVMVVAVMLAGFVALSATPVSADTCTITTTLRVGSKGAEVKCLQAALGLSADGSFGPKTKAAVVAWQVSKGLGADGIFGAKSRAAWSGAPVSTGLPAGCTSTTGYSSTTGMPCNGTPSTPVTTGPVSVALAVDNPASGSVVSPSTGSVFAKYTFTGNGTVTALKLVRGGISQNTTLPNIYLYDGVTRLTDAASLNSDNSATFNSTTGLFTVSGSKTISVVADVATSTDYSASLSLVSVTSGGVITPVNVAGNTFFIASATVATVDFGTVTPTAGAVDPANDTVVFNSNVAVGGRDVLLTRLAMRQIGSVNNTDIVNFRLMVDGVVVSTVANMDMNGYVTFPLATPKTLTTGTRVIKVLADVVAGSSRTFQFSIRNKTDLGLIDTQYNSGIAATFNSASFPASPVAATTINSGSVTVQKASTSPSGNATLNGSDVVLARYTLTTYGEALKIENVKAGFTYVNVGGGNGGGATLRNGRIVINGSQVGSTATLVPAGTTYTTNYTLAAGVPATLEIRADLYDNDGTGAIVATDTIVGNLLSSSMNTQRLSSLGYITVPSGTVAGNTLTVQSAAALTMAKTSTYGAQTTAVPQTSAYKLASYTLSGNSVEAVNLDTVAFDVTVQTGATFSYLDLTDVTLKIDGQVVGSPKSTVSATGNSFSITKSLPMNGTMLVELWGTIGSTITATHSMMLETTVSGVGASSSVASTTATGVDGQVITANTGSITATLDASRPDAAINDDAGTKTMAAFKFAAVTDSYTLTDLTFTVADVTTVSMMSLYDGNTLVASKAASATTTFNGLSWVVPAGQTKILTVKLDLGMVGVGAGSTGASTVVTLTAGTATNGAGTSDAITETDPAGTAQYTYKSIPTLALGSLPTTALVAGTNTLAKFSIGTNGTGTVGWNRMIFSITKTSAPVLANGAAFTLWNADSNTQIAGTATVVDSANAATCLATLLTCRLQFVPTTEQQVSGSTNYALKATVGGTLVTSDYISTGIAAPSTFAASTTYALVAASGGFAATYAGYGTSPSFIWSDVSASAHDTTTSDWSNDYLVRSLPLDSQTLTK